MDGNLLYKKEHKNATKKTLGLRKGLSQSAECIIVSINDSSHLNYNFMDLTCLQIIKITLHNSNNNYIE